PGRRGYERGRWKGVSHQPLRPQPDQPLTLSRLGELLRPFRDELRSCPLYVSLDKDVMTSADSIVNWDSGHLTMAEVLTVLQGFLAAAGGNLAGMDVVGDWSPVRVSGLLRRFLHLTEHPSLTVDPAEATRRNEQTNLAVLRCVQACCRPAQT